MSYTQTTLTAHTHLQFRDVQFSGHNKESKQKKDISKKKIMKHLTERPTDKQLYIIDAYR